MVSKTKTGTDNTMEKRKMIEKHEANIYKAGTGSVRENRRSHWQIPWSESCQYGFGKGRWLAAQPSGEGRRLFRLYAAGRGDHRSRLEIIRGFNFGNTFIYIFLNVSVSTINSP